MTGLLPFDDGAVHESDTDPSPGVPVTFVGAPGGVGGVGVTALEGVEAGPVPTPFVAATVNV